MKEAICGVGVANLWGKMRVKIPLCAVQSITLRGRDGQSAGESWAELDYVRGRVDNL